MEAFKQRFSASEPGSSSAGAKSKSKSKAAFDGSPLPITVKDQQYWTTPPCILDWNERMVQKEMLLKEKEMKKQESGALGRHGVVEFQNHAQVDPFGLELFLAELKRGHDDVEFQNHAEVDPFGLELFLAELKRGHDDEVGKCKMAMMETTLEELDRLGLI